MGHAGAAAGAHAAAAIANAIKASGSIVKVTEQDFLAVLRRAESPLVVTAKGGIFGGKYRYLTSYKGLTFYCESANSIMLPGGAEVIGAEKIWIPG